MLAIRWWDQIHGVQGDAREAAFDQADTHPVFAGAEWCVVGYPPHLSPLINNTIPQHFPPLKFLTNITVSDSAILQFLIAQYYSF